MHPESSLKPNDTQKVVSSFIIEELKDTNVGFLSVFNGSLLCGQRSHRTVYIHQTVTSTVEVHDRLYYAIWTANGDIIYTTDYNHDNMVVIKSVGGVEKLRVNVSEPTTISVSSNGSILVASTDGVLQFTYDGIKWKWNILISSSDGWMIRNAIDFSDKRSDIIIWTREWKSSNDFRLCKYKMTKGKSDSSVPCELLSLQQPNRKLIPLSEVNMLYDGTNVVVSSRYTNGEIFLFSVDGVCIRKSISIDYSFLLALDRMTKMLYVGQKLGQVSIINYVV